MAFDYAAIAAADPGGDLQAAYEALAAQTTTRYGELTGNQLRVWAGGFTEDYSNVKAAAAGNVHAEIALMLIQDPNSVLDIASTNIQAMIAGLLQANILSQAGHDALYGMAAVTQKTFPGLTQAHLAKARAQV